MLRRIAETLRGGYGGNKTESPLDTTIFTEANMKLGR